MLLVSSKTQPFCLTLTYVYPLLLSSNQNFLILLYLFLSLALVLICLDSFVCYFQLMPALQLLIYQRMTWVWHLVYSYDASS